MENLDVLVRGVAMQSSVPGGLGFSRSVSFQGLELLWVVIVATIVLAVMSVTRVSVMTWGWSKSGSHVRVRVQSFASLADGAIVTAGGMFSAEIVNCSADSCSEDASSSADCVSERAEMVFIFDEKGASLMTTTTTHTPRLPASVKQVSRPVVQELLLLEAVPSPQSSVPRSEGIQWDVNADSLWPVTPVVYSAPSLPSRVVRNTSSFDFDPLLKLRIRDAVVSNGGSYACRAPLAPAAIQGSGAVTTLKNDVVRVWDSGSRALTKSVHLGSGGVATAFDVNWESQVAAMAREGGAVSIANLESGAYEKCYQTQQPIVQAIHLDRASPNVVFTGGPAATNPGSVVSLYDCRSSNRELSMSLPTAVTIYGIQSRGSELYIRDESNSVATHDVRVLRPSPLTRRTTDVASQDKWWDIDPTPEDDGNNVDEDDFFDCLPSEETPGASYMSRSFVRAVSFNFSSTKATSH